MDEIEALEMRGEAQEGGAEQGEMARTERLAMEIEAEACTKNDRKTLNNPQDLNDELNVQKHAGESVQQESFCGDKNVIGNRIDGDQNRVHHSASDCGLISPTAYEEPKWSASETRAQYSFDVIKNGSLLEQIDLLKPIMLSEKDGVFSIRRGYLTFGRAPCSDFLLDHPSTSRLHAILQFGNQESRIFIFDCGSTHGTYLNKRRVTAKSYVQLHVGDQIRFGESSRVHVLCGPTELMPVEGPNKKEKMLRAAMEGYKSRKEAEDKRSMKQMSDALGKKDSTYDGASWGMGFDAEEEAIDKGFRNTESSSFADISHNGLLLDDWRDYAKNVGLNQNQQKLASRIEKKNSRIEFLEKESERIRAKQKNKVERGFEDDDELTSGQEEKLSRNINEIDKIKIEIDELEDQLLESIQHCLKSQVAHSTKEKDKVSGYDDDDDSFYDRTKYSSKHKRLGSRNKSNISVAGSIFLSSPNKRQKLIDHVPSNQIYHAGHSVNEAIDAEFLFNEIIKLQDELSKVQKSLNNELSKEIAATKVSHANNVVLDFGDSSSNVQPSDGSNLSNPSNIQNNDTLDAYMQFNDANLERSNIKSFEHRMEIIQKEMLNAQKLLQVADPDGYFQKKLKHILPQHDA